MGGARDCLPAAQPCILFGRTHLRRHVDEHHGFGLPLQRVLQQLRELRIAEGHVAVLVGQGCHDVAQRREAAVDVLGLFQALSRRFAAAHPLASCSVATRCSERLWCTRVIAS